MIPTIKVTCGITEAVTNWRIYCDAVTFCLYRISTFCSFFSWEFLCLHIRWLTQKKMVYTTTRGFPTINVTVCAHFGGSTKLEV